MWTSGSVTSWLTCPAFYEIRIELLLDPLDLPGFYEDENPQSLEAASSYTSSVGFGNMLRERTSQARFVGFIRDVQLTYASR